MTDCVECSREIAEICLNCTSCTCDYGFCKRYSDKVRELRGKAAGLSANPEFILDKRSRLYEYNGQWKTVSEWARTCGINVDTLFTRLNRGTDFVTAITTPVKNNTQYIEYNGETHTIGKWARLYGLSGSTLKNRLIRGWSMSDALTTPPIKCNNNKEK